jgi:hypothetical protein
VRFCSEFSKFKTKLYTGKLLTQVSHRKTTNSRKHNNGNTFTNNKPNHSTRSRFSHLIQEGCVGKHLSSEKKNIFRELLDLTVYFSLTLITKSKSKLFYDRRSAGKSNLISGCHSCDQFFFLFHGNFLQIFAVILLLGALSDERIALHFSCYWSSSAQSFSSLSPVGLVTIFH